MAIVGLNVEFVAALPVLMPLAERPRDCVPGKRFVALLDEGVAGTVTPPDIPSWRRADRIRRPSWN